MFQCNLATQLQLCTYMVTSLHSVLYQTFVSLTLASGYTHVNSYLAMPLYIHVFLLCAIIVRDQIIHKNAFSFFFWPQLLLQCCLLYGSEIACTVIVDSNICSYIVTHKHNMMALTLPITDTLKIIFIIIVNTIALIITTTATITRWTPIIFQHAIH